MGVVTVLAISFDVLGLYFLCVIVILGWLLLVLAWFGCKVCSVDVWFCWFTFGGGIWVWCAGWV